jgi:positive phototaxis protein PixI
MTVTLPTETQHQFLSFSLPPNIQAMLPTEQLIEILTLPPEHIVPIAQVAPEVMGVCNWRGEVLWLVDLAALIGTEPLTGYRQSNLSAIVVQHQGYTLGLVVEKISEMLRYNSAEIYPVLATPNNFKLSDCIRGCWLSPDGKTLWLLDSHSLIDSFCSNSS